MQSLHGRTSISGTEERFIARITRNPYRPAPFRPIEALLVLDESNYEPGFRAYFTITSGNGVGGSSEQPGVIPLPESLRYLTDGDIVSVRPTTGEIRVLYRKNSRFNSLLVTDSCNNKCVMCSQPPIDGQDHVLLNETLEAIPLMDVNTPELVITGGEPTLLKDRLFELICSCNSFLPRTSLLLLSNGRFFAYLRFCQELARLKHPDLTVAVPLYSDVAHEHDYIVQARGAFDQTLTGLMNLARCSQRIELRIVVHKHNFQRLPSLAEFITRNLPFVSHVALMGMEPVGYAKANLESLWVDPVDYGLQLTRAVRTLQRHRICASIYNHQLCTLDKSLWAVARQSISDWKNLFLDECTGCDIRSQCGGFFASSAQWHSRAIAKVHSL